MKKALVIIDIILILATVIPAAWLLWQCFQSAVYGTIPTGFTYGWDNLHFIYGIEAFCYTMMFLCYFLAFLVIPWVGLFFITIIYTGIAMPYVFRKSVNQSVEAKVSPQLRQ